MVLWRKIGAWTVGCFFLLFIFMVGGLAYLLRDMCDNDIYASIVSPDGKLKAVIFERSCGATTGFSTQISVIPSSEELKNEGGNVFIGSGRPEDVRPVVSWQSPSNLNISINKYIKIYNQENSWGSRWNTVYIQYK
ncbi:MAG: hypothetical protein JWM78_2107 [Verrucomicrobiaceae bacterium]|nr:hypothetical protein [Verrucomicrobiaceae bacterium]